MSDALKQAARQALEWFECLGDVEPYTLPDFEPVEDALRAALSHPEPEAVQVPKGSSGWLLQGTILYRLTYDRKPQNRDEIRVTMADGSRSEESCSRRAGELFDLLAAAPQSPAQAEPSDELGDEYEKALEELASSQGMSRRNVLRAAIRLYQAARNGLVVITHQDHFSLVLPEEAQPPAQPMSREGMKPLTREQVKALVAEAGYNTGPLQGKADFITGIRHAERAHGIGSGSGN